MCAIRGLLLVIIIIIVISQSVVRLHTTAWGRKSCQSRTETGFDKALVSGTLEGAACHRGLTGDDKNDVGKRDA